MKSKDPYFKYYNDIDSIANPLKQYKISYFAHKIIYTNGNILYLGNAPKIHEAYYKEDWRKTSPTEGNVNKFETGYYFYNFLASNLHPDAIEHFKANNAWHTFVIIKKNTEKCELFYFGTEPGNVDINNFYINNIQLLENFILNYKSDAMHIIKASENDPIFSVSNDREIKLDTMPLVTKRKNYKDQLEPFKKKLTIEFDGKLISLTNQELNCVLHMLQSNTNKEIAKILNISPRTVETHFEHIKNKFSINSKSTLHKTLLLHDVFKF